MKRLLVLVVGLSVTIGFSRAGEEKSIPGIGPVGKIVKLHSEFKFTEGPAADAKGDVFFSDIPAEKIHRVDAATGKLTTFTDNSNVSNGLMFNAKGELVASEMTGAIAAWTMDGKRRVICDKYNGKRFNAPNDLVVDKQGGVYFTDPMFRAPKPLPQEKTSVYYVDTTGKVTRLVDNLPNPNGVILSPDEKTLYVIPSGQSEMMAYPVEAPGKIGSGRVFCTLQGKKGSGGDGLTVDSKGNLYITSGLGLQVFDATGKALGIIAFPEQPANVTFGGADLKTLYVTARTSLYTAPMAVKGHRFPGGK